MDQRALGAGVELDSSAKARRGLTELKPGEVLRAGGIAHDHPARRAEFVMMPDFHESTPHTLVAELRRVSSGLQAALIQRSDGAATKLQRPNV